VLRRVTTVRLIDGPFAGQAIEIRDPRSGLIIEGADVPEGMVARYRPTRKRREMRFKGYDRVACRIPVPGQEAKK
jgi:hypothetical protein